MIRHHNKFPNRADCFLTKGHARCWHVGQGRTLGHLHEVLAAMDKQLLGAKLGKVVGKVIFQIFRNLIKINVFLLFNQPVCGILW